MPRLFSGLPLPAETTRQLERVQTGLKSTRWIDAADMHLTLRFLGDVEQPVADTFLDELAAIEAPPFTLQIDGLDAFGHNRPHSLFARIATTPQLDHLQQAHEAAARRAGLPPETRKFTPHVTIARCRGEKPAAIATWLQANALLLTKPFAVDSFIVWSAKESTGGGPYVLEAEYDLLQVSEHDHG